jgi:putative transposase
MAGLAGHDGGADVSLHALRPGHYLKIGEAEYRITQRLPERKWQLQNTITGEWCVFGESDLLDQFARHELYFVTVSDNDKGATQAIREKLTRDLSQYAPELVVLAKKRVQYLQEIDRQQPIAITQTTIQPLTCLVAARINDTNPPGWRTVCRDYRKWLAAGRDIRAIIPRHAEKGRNGSRMVPEAKSVTDQVVQELYMTPERKRVPELYLEIVRRLAEENRFRPECTGIKVPSRSTIYREIQRLPLYEVMVARYGKRRAEMEFRVSGAGPETSRALQRVSMDHTPSDLIVVDDDTMLPLGRPTITSALDEHTRCLMGFYAGFEPPSYLSVMRCLKHAILPKTYVARAFPSVKNSWECYGVPELVVVDNPPEFHSSHFERACLQLGIDIQYAKVLVPWYKGKLERFQGTMNHDLMHGNPGTTFSNILERDEYDPTRHAVVMLSTFREMLHKWIVDVYLETPHRGIQDTPAHRWRSESCGLPPPLPPSAHELEVTLGMITQRTIFHYGIELEGLKFNGPELGELRRRLGRGAKVELTFDPGDLGHINVLDVEKGVYVCVPAVDAAYARGLSLWQHKVIRRYAQQQLNARTDVVALAQAKAEVRALVERDFKRKSTHGRKRHARFLENHISNRLPISDTVEHFHVPAEANAVTNQTPNRPDVFTDDDILPVFEANFDLPRLPQTRELPNKRRVQ